MSSIGYERELGGVQEKLKRLEEEMSAMREDVREIRDAVALNRTIGTMDPSAFTWSAAAQSKAGHVEVRA